MSQDDTFFNGALELRNRFLNDEITGAQLIVELEKLHISCTQSATNETLEAVLTVVNVLLEDVAEQPNRVGRAQVIARRDIAPFIQSASGSLQADYERVCYELDDIKAAICQAAGDEHWQDGLRKFQLNHSATRAPSEPAWVWGLKQEGIRDEVAQFAALMERKLKANDHKDHWSDSGMSYLLKRLREELVELERILLAQSVPTTEEVAGEAADVANFAMMIADNFGALPHLPAPPVSSDSYISNAAPQEPDSPQGSSMKSAASAAPPSTKVKHG